MKCSNGFSYDSVKKMKPFANFAEAEAYCTFCAGLLDLLTNCDPSNNEFVFHSRFSLLLCKEVYESKQTLSFLRQINCYRRIDSRGECGVLPLS